MIPQRPVSRRTFLAGAIATTGALAGLTACGTAGPGASGSAQVWVLSSPALNPIQQDAIDRFNETATVKMELVTVPAGQRMNDKVRTAMGTPNRPDVFFNWSGGSIRDYARSDALVDFTPEFEADHQWRESFLKPVLDAGQIDGKYYAIPMKGIQPAVLYYNKTLFGQNGVQPPATWDDLLGLVDAFTGKGITPLIVAGTDPWTELMYLEYLIDRLGGPSVFADIAAGRPDAWQNPVVLDSLTMIRSLVDRGAFGSNYSSIGYGNGSAAALFAKGRGAMMLMGTWLFTDLQHAEPEFTKNDLDFVNFPAVPGGTGDPENVVGNPTNYFSVTTSDRSSACVDFLKQQMSSDAYVDALIRAGEIPAIAGIGSAFDNAPQPDFARAIYDMVNRAPHFTLSWDQALDQAEGQDVVTNLQKVFDRSIQPADFVAAMAAAAGRPR